MCGRFVGNFNVEDLFSEMSDALSLSDMKIVLPDTNMPLMHNFNVAPTHEIPILRVMNDVIQLDVVRWGLLPIWSKDASRAASMINARSETLTEKPSFKGLVAGHRCIIPMTGFYEWDRTDVKAKIPYFVTRKDGGLMLAAGLWSESPVVESRTCALITRDSVSDLSHIHDRSPVEFHAEEALEWLTPGDAPLQLFEPNHQPQFRTTRVSTRVNSVRNNDATLIDQVFAEPEDEPEQELKLF